MFNVKLHDTGRTYPLSSVPEICPICHSHIVANLICALSNKNTNSNYESAEVLFQCNNTKCSHIFIAIYEYVESSDKKIAEQKIVNLSPKKVKPLEINPEIKVISPMFYKIYLQALEAESQDLNEISGVGFRKALEFLIKDYCIKENPSKEETIKNRPLMQVINDYMNEAPKVKSCATKAVWLGNDETHYVRKWEDKDIKDLKILISLTIHHIESELMTAQFEADMA